MLRLLGFTHTSCSVEAVPIWNRCARAADVAVLLSVVLMTAGARCLLAEVSSPAKASKVGVESVPMTGHVLLVWVESPQTSHTSPSRSSDGSESSSTVAAKGEEANELAGEADGEVVVVDVEDVVVVAPGTKKFALA